MATSTIITKLSSLPFPPSQAIPVPALVATQELTIIGGLILLTGWAIANGATANEVSLYNGASNGGPLVAPLNIAANDKSTISISASGILCNNGLTIWATKATLASAVWINQVIG